MNTSHQKFLRCASAALVLGICATRAGDKTATVSQPEAASPRSMFVDDARVGKDPFFPESGRRLVMATRVVSTNNSVPQASPVLDQIKLKGISGTKEQRLALINGSTIAAGESGDVHVLGTTIKVLCREIRDGSVIIEVLGTSEVRELKLRDGVR